MNRMIVMLSLVLLCNVTLADSWCRVETDKSGAAIMKLTCSSAQKHALKPNEYPVDYAFPAVPLKYWKKAGADWIAMTAEEQAAVDAKIQQAAADSSLDGVEMDALFKLLVHLNDPSVKGKDYAYIANYFKNSVSVEKAEKQKKAKKNP